MKTILPNGDIVQNGVTTTIESRKAFAIAFHAEDAKRSSDWFSNPKSYSSFVHKQLKA